MGAIWALSFDRDNRKVMVENEDLRVIPLLLNLKSSDDVKVKAAANGTLWNLREDLKKTEQFHDLGRLPSCYVLISFGLWFNIPANSYGHVVIFTFLKQSFNESLDFCNHS